METPGWTPSETFTRADYIRFLADRGDRVPVAELEWLREWDSSQRELVTAEPTTSQQAGESRS
jgi:hypothetical protein